MFENSQPTQQECFSPHCPKEFERKPILQPAYDFSTGVMRTSRYIHSVAKELFNRNHFIRVSTTEPAILRECQRNRFWHRSTNIAPYKDYQLRLHLQTRFQAPKAIRKQLFFMICLDNLEAFVWILRFTEVTFELCFNMMFELMESHDTPLAPKVQQQSF
jgi:hypothetical protein